MDTCNVHNVHNCQHHTNQCNVYDCQYHTKQCNVHNCQHHTNKYNVCYINAKCTPKKKCLAII